MKQNTRYFDANEPLGCFDVVYIVNSSGVKLVTEFDEYKHAMDFVEKSEHGKTITLVMYPNR